MRNSIFAVSLVASLAAASLAAHADPVDAAIAAAAPAKPQGWQADVRSVAGLSSTGTGDAAVVGLGLDAGKRSGDIYVGASVDASTLALMTPGGWGGSLLRAGVELRDYVSDHPGIVSNCFGTYPARNEIYVGVRGGAERAADAFQNEDVGGFGELTLGGEQVTATATRGLYLTVGASVAPDASDAPSSPATSVYAMGGFQLTFG